MKLIIGGYAQGKLAYVLEQESTKTYRILDGEKLRDMDLTEETKEAVILNHFHLWVREGLQAGGDPQGETRRFVDRFPDCVIICDEIGNGIVPLEAFEREYREQTGRILTMLAKEAEEVVRVVCGIGQRIK